MLTGALSTGTVESSGTEQVISIIFAGLGDRALLVARDEKKAGVTPVAVREEGSQSEVCVGNITGNPDCSTISLAEFENLSKLKALICRVGSTGLGPS